MPLFYFTVYEVNSSYYLSDAQSLVLSKDTLEISDTVDDELHRTQAEDPQNDQTFDFAGESAVTDYTVQYLDFAQVNGAGPEYELFAMQVSFADGAVKYYVMSKDPGFDPNVGDDLQVTTFSNFVSTSYGQIGAAVCFTAGTHILTDRGTKLVEQMRVGDWVQTRDNGCQEVLWIGRRTLTQNDLRRAEPLRPVLIRKGALGNARPLLVSQQHRILLPHQAPLVQSIGSEAFIRAKHLAMFVPKAARIAHGKRTVTYFHILLGSHEVVFANGVACESLYPDPMALMGISRQDRHEVEQIFPELRNPKTMPGPAPFELARPVLAARAISEQARRGGLALSLVG